MIYSFKGHIPVIHESSFVHPLAAITGNVIIGKNCYIGPGAAIRGDWGEIILEDGVNVQENCTVHMFPGKSIVLKDISDEMIAWKTAGTRLYQQLPADCHESLREVEPLREIPKNRPVQEDFYNTLEEFRKK